MAAAMLKKAVIALAGMLGAASLTNAQVPPSALQSQVNALPWTNGNGLLTGADIQMLYNTTASVFLTWSFGAPFGLPQAPWADAPDARPCAAGQISVDANYIYVCTATNTLKRAALSSF